MPRAKPLIASFNAGELSPLMEGRADFAKYNNGCRRLENWLPLIQGGVTKRPGTVYAGRAKHHDQQTRVVPFEFSTEQAYILELGHLYMRVYIGGSVVLDGTSPAITGVTNASPAVVTSVAHGLSAGDRVFITGVVGMTELNGREFEVGIIDVDHVSLIGLDSSTYTAYTSGGILSRILDVATPWTESDLDSLVFAQSADVLYAACPAIAPTKISRTSNTAWTVEEIDFDWPPFAAENITDTTMSYTISTGGLGASGTGTITASAAAFAASDVGRMLQISEILEEKQDGIWEPEATGPMTSDRWYYEGNVYSAQNSPANVGRTPPLHRGVGQIESDGDCNWLYYHSGSGYVEITGYTSSTVVSVTIIRRIPDSAQAASTTTKWAFGAWDEINGYPRAVTFFEDRLWWGGADGSPQTFYGSRPGNYENHEVTDDDEGAVFFALNTDQVNAIQWMKAKQLLVLGTSASEWSVSAASGVRDAISAGNVRAEENSTEGSRPGLPALAINDAVLFAQRDGRKLNELVFDFDTDQFVARDLTRLAEHVTLGKIRDMAFQQEPYRIVWAVLEDGGLVALTYERREDVIAWHRHVLGGTDVFLESVAALPRADGEGDQVWFVVRRTVDGATVRHIESMGREWRQTDAIQDAGFVDSALVYDGTPTTALSGLWHLEGETPDVLADGFVVTTGVVTSGQLTLAEAASKVRVGLGYDALLETMRLEAPLQDGTAQGRRSRIESIVLRLDQAGAGLFYGPTDAIVDEVSLRELDDVIGEPVPLRSKDTQRLEWPPGGELRGERIVLKHTLPLPCTVLAAMPQFTVEAE